VSSDRQTTENQFEDLLREAERDGSVRDWLHVRRLLADVIQEEQRPSSAGGSRVVYRLNSNVALQLAEQCIYVEQGKSGSKTARMRPLYQRMKKDAALRKFDRLLVWKVSRLGRDMREVIDTVYELAEAGVTVVPLKSQTGPITTTMGKLLWAINAWYAEMENDERSESIRAGHARARTEGRAIGRPHVIFRRESVIELRDGNERLSWSQIAARLGVSVGTVRRVYHEQAGAPGACQNSGGDAA